MKIIFIGAVNFSACALRELISMGVDVVRIDCNPEIFYFD